MAQSKKTTRPGPATRAIVPVAQEQRQVLLAEDEHIVAVRLEDGSIYVPLRQLCESLGLDYDGQRQRIRRDGVMEHGLMMVAVETPGGRQRMQCFLLTYIPYWVSGIEMERIRADLRDRLRAYKEWVIQKVYQAFATEVGLPTTTTPATTPAESDPITLSLEQVAELGRALTAMAEQQLAFQREQERATTEIRGALSDHERRLAIQEGRMDRAAQVMGETIRDVRALKSRLDPGNAITDEQAAELQETIKMIAQELTRQSTGSGQQKNYYASLFSELHRRFSVSTYKNLTIGKYEQAMAWLRDYGAALGGTPVDPLDRPR